MIMRVSSQFKATPAALTLIRENVFLHWQLFENRLRLENFFAVESTWFKIKKTFYGFSIKSWLNFYFWTQRVEFSAGFSVNVLFLQIYTKFTNLFDACTHLNEFVKVCTGSTPTECTLPEFIGLGWIKFFSSHSGVFGCYLSSVENFSSKLIILQSFPLHSLAFHDTTWTLKQKIPECSLWTLQLNAYLFVTGKSFPENKKSCG